MLLENIFSYTDSIVVRDVGDEEHIYYGFVTRTGLKLFTPLPQNQVSNFCNCMQLLCPVLDNLLRLVQALDKRR